MFQELFDYAYERSGKQAFGFYLFYLLIAFVLLMILGPLIGPETIPEAELAVMLDTLQNAGEMDDRLATYIQGLSFISAIISVSFGTGLTLAIVLKKQIFKNIKMLVIVIGAVLLCYFFGPLIGFIPIAWLTTKPSHDPDEAV